VKAFIGKAIESANLDIIEEIFRQSQGANYGAFTNMLHHEYDLLKK
jgi:hypothetical protein